MEKQNQDRGQQLSDRRKSSLGRKPQKHDTVYPAAKYVNAPACHFLTRFSTACGLPSSAN
jgi:hypothetical protein